MKNRTFSWILIAVSSALVSAGFAKLLGWVVSLSSPNMPELQSAVFVFGFFTSLMFALGLAMAIRWRSERDQAIREIQSALLQKTETEVRAAVVDSVSTVVFPLLEGPGARTVGARLFEMMHQTIERNSSLPTDVMLAKIVLLQEGFNGLNRELEKITSDGILVDIAGHLRVTRALLMDAHFYLQIQTNLKLSPETWTTVWKEFLDEMNKKDMEKRYVLYGTKKDFDNNQESIAQVVSYLSQRGFYVGFCDSEEFVDSHSSSKVDNSVIEFFGGNVIKCVRPEKGEYRGGKKVKMTITSQIEDVERNMYLNFIDQHTVELKPDIAP